MNFISEYFEIIGNRLLNPLPVEVKGERHHIFPKSIGGSNNKSNIVKLTPKEHYKCHELLVEMFRDSDENAFQRMLYAWNMISHTREGLAITAEEYEKYKEEYSKVHSKRMKNRESPTKGMHWTLAEETRQKMRKPKSEEHKKKLQRLLKIGRENRIVSEETRKRLSEAGKGRVQTQETREKISAAHKGEVKSEEHRRKISETLTGRKDPEEVRKKKAEASKRRWANLTEEERLKISEKKKAYWAKRKAAQHLQS